MKTIDKIIESQEAPKDKNVLWVKGDKLLAMVKGKWTPVGGGSSDNVQGGGAVAADCYFKKEDIPTDMLGTFICLSHLIKIDGDNLKAIQPTAYLLENFTGMDPAKENTVALSISPKDPYHLNVGGQLMEYTIEDALASMGIDINSISQITKEEFYNLS